MLLYNLSRRYVNYVFIKKKKNTIVNHVHITKN